MIVPPGMPNTTLHPTASSERTSDCAPVTRTGAPLGAAGLGRLACGGGVGTGFCRDMALVIWSASRSVGGSGHEKTPADRHGSYEGRASTQLDPARRRRAC